MNMALWTLAASSACWSRRGAITGRTSPHDAGEQAAVAATCPDTCRPDAVKDSCLYNHRNL